MSSSSSTPAAFDSFKSKKILRLKPEPAKVETPVTPSRRQQQPRRCLMSVKQIREAASKLRSGRNPGKKCDLEVGFGSGFKNENMNKKKKKKGDGSGRLPEKFEELCIFFDCMHSSLRLLRFKGQMPSLKNITLQIECLTEKRFSIVHLAQLKFILPEAIELKKMLVRDERTFCMKPELHVTLLANAIKNNEEQRNGARELDIKSIFRNRMMEFVKAHPEEEVPEGQLPEPFDRSNVNVNIASEKPCNSTSLNKTSIEVVIEQPATVASHLPTTFTKRFSKQVSSPSITEKSKSKPISQLKSSSVGDSQASVPFHRLPETPIKVMDCLKNKVSPSEETPSKVTSTPGKPMSATPVLAPPKRCFMTPDADLTNSPNKLVRRSNRYKTLEFDTPVKTAKVENEVKFPVEDLSSDDDIYDICQTSLLQSIREKALKIQEDKDPAISQAKRRQHMIEKLPNLFDIIRYSFRSSKCLITKEEFLHKLITIQLGIIDKKEVEEQLVLLKELVPDLICEKLASSGDHLIGIKEISSPELIRARLVGAKFA